MSAVSNTRPMTALRQNSIRVRQQDDLVSPVFRGAQSWTLYKVQLRGLPALFHFR